MMLLIMTLQVVSLHPISYTGFQMQLCKIEYNRCVCTIGVQPKKVKLLKPCRYDGIPSSSKGLLTNPGGEMVD